MVAGIVLSLLVQPQATQDLPFASKGPELRYRTTYRRAVPSDYPTRTTKDKRVTYLKDYRVKVRLPGKPVTLRRPRPVGVIDVQAIGKDGSILYEWQDAHERESYTWANGRSTRIRMTGYDRTKVVGYRDRRHFYAESMVNVGAKGLPLSGIDLFRVTKGLAKRLGPGELIAEVRPGLAVAGARVRADGRAAGMDDDGQFELRLYDAEGFAKLPGTDYLGCLPDGTLVTAVEAEIPVGSGGPVAEGDIPHQDPRRTGVPRVSTIFHWRNGQTVRAFNVFGYPTAMNAKGQILLFEGHTDFIHPWILVGDTVRPVDHDLPSSIRRFPFGFGSDAGVTLTDAGVITMRGNDQADDTVVITMRPK